jgi:hypothetical protein
MGSEDKPQARKTEFSVDQNFLQREYNPPHITLARRISFLRGIHERQLDPAFRSFSTWGIALWFSSYRTSSSDAASLSGPRLH